MNMLTAYPLSKKDLPFRKACITYLFITMLIGGGLTITAAAFALRPAFAQLEQQH